MVANLFFNKLAHFFTHKREGFFGHTEVFSPPPVRNSTTLHSLPPFSATRFAPNSAHDPWVIVPPACAQNG